MDDLFYFDQDADDYMLMSLASLLPPPVVDQGSAFTAYRPPPSFSHHSSGSRANVHRSMHRYLRSINDGSTSSSAGAQAPPPPDEPLFRHITRERLRRERLSQGFADLHALLPPGRASKGGKNTVVRAAADYIRELEGRKRRLSARNEELVRDAAPPARSSAACSGGMVVKVRAKSDDYASDVFEVVLRQLKAMEELRVTAIQSCFRAGEMCMDVGVESKISSCEVDKAITNALMEHQGIEFGCLQDPTKSKLIFTCQVVSGVLMRES